MKYAMRFYVTSIAILVLSILALGCTREPYTPEQIARFVEGAVTIEAVQPPLQLVEAIERSVSAEHEGVQAKGDALIKDHLPYFAYYSIKDSNLSIIHPMDAGRFLRNMAGDPKAPDYVDAFVNLAHELPNGGLAWYYPRHYNVARMLGPHLKYSAISQGSIIAGLTATSKANKAIPSDLADKAFSAMYWPFEKGGVNLNDVSILEMPSFSGPPEIVLNGWIDALIHTRDFGIERNDQRALDLFKRNITFLSKILSNFDAPDQSISRYSDLSPYLVKVKLDSEQAIDSLRVLYVPKVKELAPILVPLERTPDPNNFSPYENQIFSQNGKNAFVWLSCSQLYNTILIGDSSSISLDMKTGTFDRKASTPGPKGEIYSPFIHEGKDMSYAVLGSDDGLICGYPTNFVKGGVENVYHSYHVVGLLLLAMGDAVTQDQRKELITWALKWYDDMKIVAEVEGRQFHDPQSLLKHINGGRLSAEYTNFDALLSEARKQL